MRARRFAWLAFVVSCLAVPSIRAPTAAAAGTALELLHGGGYHQDVNGSRERTILRGKTLEAWQYGSLFLYYDMTEPFTPAGSAVLPN